jgi:hypothetical protein
MQLFFKKKTSLKMINFSKFGSSVNIVTKPVLNLKHVLTIEASKSCKQYATRKQIPKYSSTKEILNNLKVSQITNF